MLVQHPNRPGWPNTQDTNHPSEEIRKKYRRVDVYALGGTPLGGAIAGRADNPNLPPVRRDSLIPAPGRAVSPAKPLTPKGDYRVMLKLEWDKPHASGLGDLTPSLAEFEYAWSPADANTGTFNFNNSGVPLQGSREVYTFYGKWIHDDLTEFTKVTLGLRSDGDRHGLAATTNRQLNAATAFGPMLLSSIDGDIDTVGEGGRLAAFGVLAAAAQVIIEDGTAPNESQVALIAFEAEAETDSLAAPGEDYKIKLTVEYTNTLNLDFGILGVKTTPAVPNTSPDFPMKLRYRKVGAEFDGSQENFWDGLGFSYASDSLSIEEPGKWTVSGTLGDLLRISEITFGVGSLWVEVKLAAALDLGVVEISDATMRFTFDGTNDPDFSLRGLTANIDIPGAIKGNGSLRIDDAGGIKAGIEASIVPLKLSAAVAMGFASKEGPPPYTFVNIFVKVMFPVGVPLGPSGAALHGILGQVVVNGTRNIGTQTDVVSRELAWWGQSPQDKYEAMRGQHALGVGVVIGTMPDASFCFSATGMLVVAFPDPEVILGVECKLLDIPVRMPNDAARTGDASIVGLIIIDDQAVTAAISANFSIDKLIEVNVPIGAHFPYSGTGTYVRIGADGFSGRTGARVTITFLPGTLDLRAWSYLMIEQDGLPSLGGKPEYSFDGFSVGFGAGVELNWSAGPIKLDASAYVLVGFGTDPLFIKGGLFVSGKLDLKVVSISVHGSIEMTYKAGNVFLDGEFCGEVDMWFFSLKGCVKFKIGNEAALPVTEPDPPVVRIALTDRQGRIMGGAKEGATGSLSAQPIFATPSGDETGTNDGADPLDNNTVWPDTAPVLNFRHYAIDAIPAGSTIDPGTQHPGEEWFGSNRLKFAYRVTAVRLLDETNGNVEVGPSDQVEAVWMTKPERPPDSAALPDGPQASGAETTLLKLLHWDPFSWAEPTEDGGAGQPGDPVDVIDRICDPVPEPRPACLFGRNAAYTAPHRVRMVQQVPAAGPFPSRFKLNGAPGILGGGQSVEGMDFVTSLIGTGAVLQPGGIADLPAPVSVGGESLTRGYKLPVMERVQGDDFTATAAPWIGHTDLRIVDGLLKLVVCDSLGDAGATPVRRCFDFTGLRVGGEHLELTTDQFSARALDRNHPIVITDRVNSAIPGTGQDRIAEITVPFTGVLFRFRQPSIKLEIAFMRPAEGDTKFIGTDAQGNKVPLTVSHPPNTVGKAVLTSALGIVTLEVRPKAKSISIWSLCYTASRTKPVCVSFKGVKPDQGGLKSVAAQGLTVEVLRGSDSLRTQDSFALESGRPRPGSDGNAEIWLPDSGATLRLPAACAHVSLSLWLGGGRVTAEALNSDDKVIAQAATRDGATALMVLHLNAPEPVSRLRVIGGSGEALLIRVCCHDGIPGRICSDLTLLRKKGDFTTLTLPGFLLRDPRDQERLNVDDLYDAEADARGKDGTPEIGFSNDGMTVTVTNPVTGRIHLTLWTPREDLRIEALTATGRRVDEARLPRDRSLRQVTLEGAGIATLVIAGGRGNARLVAICREEDETTAPVTPSQKGLPVVSSPQGDRMVPWEVVATETLGPNGCRLVTYATPPVAEPLNDFMILTTGKTLVTLVSLCGIDENARAAHEQEEDARQDTGSGLPDGGTGDPTDVERVLLEPDKTYRIEIDWEWAHWASDDGTGSPNTPNNWTPAQRSQVFRFRTASETQNAGVPDDGLNEHQFDPRDISRYLTTLEPGDGREMVFTDDPVWAHFATRHLPHLLEAFERELSMDIRRTDPPPQAGGRDLTDELPQLTGALGWVVGLPEMNSVRANRLNHAISTAPCLADQGPFGGAALQGDFELEPLAMYDFSLLAQLQNGTDPRVVSATRFRTSRYASPEAMITAFDVDLTGVHPIPPEEILLRKGTLPSGALDVSDREMQAAMDAIGAGLIEPPDDRPHIYLLWQLQGTDWKIGGVLLDAPESLSRTATARTADGRATQTVIRCHPDQVVIGGTAFVPVRSTVNWTRVLLVPPAHVLPDADASLRLEFTTSDGPVSGQRIVPQRPTAIQAEGF